MTNKEIIQNLNELGLYDIASQWLTITSQQEGLILLVGTGKSQQTYRKPVLKLIKNEELVNGDFSYKKGTSAA